MRSNYKKSGTVDGTPVQVELWADGVSLGDPKFGTILPVCGPIGQAKIVRTEDHRVLKFQWLKENGSVEILEVVE